MTWTVRDVEPGQLWEDGDGKLWRVLGVAHKPTVTLVEVETHERLRVLGQRRRNHVIESPQFSMYRKMVPTAPGEQRVTLQPLEGSRWVLDEVVWTVERVYDHASDLDKAPEKWVALREAGPLGQGSRAREVALDTLLTEGREA